MRYRSQESFCSCAALCPPHLFGTQFLLLRGRLRQQRLHLGIGIHDCRNNDNMHVQAMMPVTPAVAAAAADGAGVAKFGSTFQVADVR